LGLDYAGSLKFLNDLICLALDKVPTKGSSSALVEIGWKLASCDSPDRAHRQLRLSLSTRGSLTGLLVPKPFEGQEFLRDGVLLSRSLSLSVLCKVEFIDT